MGAFEVSVIALLGFILLALLSIRGLIDQSCVRAMREKSEYDQKWYELMEIMRSIEHHGKLLDIADTPELMRQSNRILMGIREDISNK